MLVSVIACLSTTFAALAWIGWRYFVSPKPNPRAARRDRVFVHEVAPQPADTNASERGQICSTPGFSASTHGPLAIAFALVLLSAATVVALSGSISLEPLSAQRLTRQKHIQAALSPEELVPPPPLPPGTFVGTERPGLETANREWGRLDPDFMAVALRIFARTEARGYKFALLEGYRSPGRQDALADSGVHVTNARAFQSKHQYGLALDAAPLRNGKLVISEKDPWAMEAYLVLGEEAEKAGLLWGGRWKLKDYGHIEAAGLISQREKHNQLGTTR